MEPVNVPLVTDAPEYVREPHQQPFEDVTLKLVVAGNPLKVPVIDRGQQGL
jgi:hypothetical protein